MDKFARYHRSVEFLEGLANLRYKYYAEDKSGDKSIYLKRTRYFLNLLGNPDYGIKFIHVTGTSGKGSVCSYLHEVLLASGKKAGLFTSPFVVTTIEKIKVGNLYISPDEFADLVEEVKPALDRAYAESPHGGPAYFEVILAIGLLYFKRKKCEWAVLEVGMGGKYDATNVIKNPVATIITNIGYDHTETLGKTLTKIAGEKGGIIKPGAKFWTTERRPHLLKIFNNVCRTKGIKFNVIKRKDKDYLNLNKELVRHVARDLKFSDQTIERGIKKSRMPARFEIMQKNPLVVIDGAHNESKIETTLSNLKKLKYRKLHVVVTFAKSKDYVPMLEKFLSLGDHIIFTRFETPLRKCADPGELLRVAKERSRNVKFEMTLDPSMALKRALKSAHPNDLVLCTGSFFLSGHVRQHWYPEGRILKNRHSF